ncbi:MAG TPA: YbaN family protein [Aestuariivirga sp.]|nr:YbaN family protein [Alphaproteobacteria bacterium]HRX35964.1 YbaN family protein [Aestuariivirga sp.]
MRALTKPLLIGTGWMCVGLGIIGIIMPMFPTTPFLLVAVWAFSKSSPELAERIRNHRLAGPYIRDWQDEGVIPVKAKIIAVVMMAAMLAYLHFVAKPPPWTVASAATVMAAVAIFIITRPSRRRSQH